MSDNFNQGSYSVQEQNNNSMATKVNIPSYQRNSDIFNLGGTEANAAKSALNTAEAQRSKIQNERIAQLTGQALKSVSDVMASNTQLTAIEEASETNIFMMNYQKSLIMNAGMQAALDRRMEGELNADNAALQMAAQGQGLSSAGVEKLLASYRAIALDNAAREESRMYAEMAGIDMQIANENYNVRMAGIQNDMALAQGILGTLGSLAGTYYGGASGTPSQPTLRPITESGNYLNL